MSIEDTDGPDRDKAREAVRAARQRATVTDSLVQQAHAAVEQVREWREDNHFTEKMRGLIRHGA